MINFPQDKYLRYHLVLMKCLNLHQTLKVFQSSNYDKLTTQRVVLKTLLLRTKVAQATEGN